MRSRRQRSSSFPLARIFAIVVALHVAAGGVSLWIAKTQSGQEFAREYKLRFFEPPKPPDVAKVEPPPPPPPLPEIEKPKVQEVAPPAPSPVASAVPAPRIEGVGAGGTNWNGKFSGESFDGPEGAFHAGVMGRFRRYYSEPTDSFGAAELELIVTSSGGVRGYRLLKSSGNERNDEAILAAAARVQNEGVAAPPGGKARTVTVRFVPSS